MSSFYGFLQTGGSKAGVTMDQEYIVQTPESWMRHIFGSLWSQENDQPKDFTDITFACSGNIFFIL